MINGNKKESNMKVKTSRSQMEIEVMMPCAKLNDRGN